MEMEEEEMLYNEAESYMSMISAGNKMVHVLFWYLVDFIKCVVKLTLCHD